MLEEELEAVEAILMDGVDRQMDEEAKKVLIRLDPLTASDEEKKYVSLVLELQFPDAYPDEAPTIQIRNPRGLSETSVTTLLTALKDKAEEFATSAAPVIFELVCISVTL